MLFLEIIGVTSETHIRHRNILSWGESDVLAGKPRNDVTDGVVIGAAIWHVSVCSFSLHVMKNTV
jgi:hypothetical protein